MIYLNNYNYLLIIIIINRDNFYLITKCYNILLLINFHLQLLK